MRDIVVGGSGLVLGGILGGGFILGAELLVAGAVGVTLLLVSPADETPPAVAQAQAQAQTQAPSEPTAAAGQIHVMTTAAVQLLVDGRMAPYTTEGFLMDATPGSHRVELVDLLGNRRVDTTVTVYEGTRHSFRWRRKTFEPMGTHGRLDAPVVAAPPGHGQVQVESHTRVEGDMQLAAAEMEREMERANAEIEAANAVIEEQLEQIPNPQIKVGGVPIEVPIPKFGFGKRKGKGRSR